MNNVVSMEADVLHTYRSN